MDELRTFLTSPGPPLYVIALIAFVTAFKVYPSVLARINERRRDKATAASSLFEHYETRLERLEASEAKCRHDLGAALHRLAELEGFVMGQGAARQDAARIVAVERAKDGGKPSHG